MKSRNKCPTDDLTLTLLITTENSLTTDKEFTVSRIRK